MSSVCIKGFQGEISNRKYISDTKLPINISMLSIKCTPILGLTYERKFIGRCDLVLLSSIRLIFKDSRDSLS